MVGVETEVDGVVGVEDVAGVKDALVGVKDALVEVEDALVEVDEDRAMDNVDVLGIFSIVDMLLLVAVVKVVVVVSDVFSFKVDDVEKL